MVLEVLAPRQQLLVVGRGLEEASVLRVGETLDHGVGQGTRLGEPARIEAGLVQGEQRLEQERVVLQVGVELGLAVLPGAQQPPVGVAQRAEHELRTAGRRLHVVGALEHGAGLGQRGDHQGVPGGQALVVEARPDALRPHVVETPAPLRERFGPARAAHRDVVALEVAGRRWPRTRRSPRRPRGRPPARLASPRPTTRRTCPPRPRSPRRGRSRSRPRAPSSRAAPSRGSPRRRRETARRRAPASRAGRRGPAARCRRASSRSGAPARWRRPSSARSRRPPGRTSPRGHRPQRVRRHLRLPAAQEELDDATRAGTWARRRSRRSTES